jgi:hypothetical protein
MIFRVNFISNIKQNFIKLIIYLYLSLYFFYCDLFYYLEKKEIEKDFGISIKENLSIREYNLLNENINDNHNENDKYNENINYNLSDRDDENKILIKHESQNLMYDNKSEFTFKQNTSNKQLKTSITNNKYVNEEEKINKSDIDDNENDNKKRDPLIHDYPLEISNSVEDLI